MLKMRLVGDEPILTVVFVLLFTVEVYPRPDGTVYICGIGGSDYVSTAALKDGAFQDVCEANPTRVQAA